MFNELLENCVKSVAQKNMKFLVLFGVFLLNCCDSISANNGEFLKKKMCIIFVLFIASCQICLKNNYAFQIKPHDIDINILE